MLTRQRSNWWRSYEIVFAREPHIVNTLIEKSTSLAFITSIMGRSDVVLDENAVRSLVTALDTYKLHDKDMDDVVDALHTGAIPEPWRETVYDAIEANLTQYSTRYTLTHENIEGLQYYWKNGPHNPFRPLMADIVEANNSDELLQAYNRITRFIKKNSSVTATLQLPWRYRTPHLLNVAVVASPHCTVELINKLAPTQGSSTWEIGVMRTHLHEGRIDVAAAILALFVDFFTPNTWEIACTQITAEGYNVDDIIETGVKLLSATNSYKLLWWLKLAKPEHAKRLAGYLHVDRYPKWKDETINTYAGTRLLERLGDDNLAWEHLFDLSVMPIHGTLDTLIKSAEALSAMGKNHPAGAGNITQMPVETPPA